MPSASARSTLEPWLQDVSECGGVSGNKGPSGRRSVAVVGGPLPGLANQKPSPHVS